MLNLGNGRNYSCDAKGEREREREFSLVTNGNATFRYFFNMINIDVGFLPTSHFKTTIFHSPISNGAAAANHSN